MRHTRGEIEQAFADQAKLHDAITTVKAWHRAGVPALTPLEVMDLLLNGVLSSGNMREPGEEGSPPAQAAPHPRDDERDPLFGTLPVTAPKSGPDRVQAAVTDHRGGAGPPGVQGYG